VDDPLPSGSNMGLTTTHGGRGDGLLLNDTQDLALGRIILNDLND
jgi:hypothetical protein